MRTTTARRVFTNRMAIALFLATGLLTACVPTAAMANEAVPAATASASATASSTVKATATATDVVTVGAGGVLIAHSDALVTDPDTKQAVGSLAPGEAAQWISTNSAPSPAEHLISTELGIVGNVSDMAVFLFPQAGLKLDQPIVVQNAVGKKDTMSGFGGRLDREAMEIRTGPSPESEPLATAKIGQKYMASKLIKGMDSIMGQSLFAVILVDAKTESYGFLRAEAISVDQNPTAAESLTATEPDQDDTATDSPTETAEASASVTAPPAAAVTESQETPADEAPNNLPLMTGVGGLAVGIVIGAVATRRKRATEPVGAKVVDEGGDDVKAEPVDAEDAATAVEADAEDIDWDKED